MLTLVRTLAGAILLSLSFAVAAEPLDLNTADADLIAETMLGVGPQKAVEIVRYREQHGPFTSLEALGQVKGIGPQTIEQNRERVTVLQPTAQ
jgi:competence protein ComEA